MECLKQNLNAHCQNNVIVEHTYRNFLLLAYKIRTLYCDNSGRRAIAGAPQEEKRITLIEIQKMSRYKRDNQKVY